MTETQAGPDSSVSSAVQAVRAAAAAATAASNVLRAAPDSQVTAALEAAARRLPAAVGAVLEANSADMGAAAKNGMSSGMLDRLRLDAGRLAATADQLTELAAIPAEPRLAYVRDLEDGTQVFERRVPVGVIGAIYEARPAVSVDVAGQVLRARSAAVLRPGSASLRSSASLVDLVITPALEEAGLPAGAVTVLREPGHETAEALLSRPADVPLVIVRGSGETTRHLTKVGAAGGVRVLAHADGGGVMYADTSADPDRLRRLIRSGVDRLGVCNRLNLLLLDRMRFDELADLAVEELGSLGVKVALPPHSQRLGHEWALDDGNEATVTIAPVDGPTEAALLAARETSGIAATVVAEDQAAATEFLAAWDGTGGFWNTTTRLLDGYKLLGLPETGINVDRAPGPRGPVTFPDLVLRQFVVLPAGSAGVQSALT